MSGGKVYLIGAGPGEPELLTIKGLRLIESADVIVHDRLIDARLLAMANPNATLLDVGKVPGERGRTQANISELLIREARLGKTVARLKGGDPFVFGRGGEEAEALAEAGIRFEVIPGVTSAVAAPAYAGIPLTHRDYASSFTVVTASVADSKDEGAQDWEALAAMPGTLVMLMGWRALGDAAAELIAAGKPANTPAAVISWGTEPYQKTAVGRLSGIAEVARSRGLSAPATVVIGEVVRLRDRIGWFESLPLLGRRVLITRAKEQSGALSRRLAEMGALPVEAPMIEIRPPEDCTALDAVLAESPKFDWIVFASANAALAVRDRLEANGLDSRALGGVRVASVGGATAGALRSMGIVSDLTPGSATASGLADALKAAGVSGKRALLPRSDIAPRRLPDALRAAGAEVTQVVAYQTTLPDSARGDLAHALNAGVDVATFASSSAVRNLVGMLKSDSDLLNGVKIACIGPTTAATAGRLGLKVDIVSETPTAEALTRAVAAHMTE